MSLFENYEMDLNKGNRHILKKERKKLVLIMVMLLILQILDSVTLNGGGRA